MFDFVENYQSIYLNVKKNKIKFNPIKKFKKGGEEAVKNIIEKISLEINLSKDKLNDLLQVIGNLKEKTSITYAIFENIEIDEKENKLHTTVILSIDKKNFFKIRVTTKKLVKVVGFDTQSDKITIYI